VIEETKKPLVSVIMPCYKMGRFIGEALESVGKQTYTNWEVIAVDDCGPEDGTRKAVEFFAKQFPNNRIIYHRHEKNGGVSAARNTAIGMAQGEYLAFLDPDDWWEDNYLFEQMALLTSGSDLDLVYSGVCFVDFKGEKTGRFIPSSYFVASFPQSLFCNNEIHLSTVIVRKELVMAAGGFDCSPELQHIEACAIASQVRAKEYAGYSLRNGVPYPIDERAWHKFATGLDNPYSKANTLSYVQEIFDIVGLPYKREEYWLREPSGSSKRTAEEILPGAGWVGLNTGAGWRWPTRIWPEENWAGLIAKLNSVGLKPVILGGPEEVALNDRLAQQTGCLWSGVKSLDVFYAMVARCDALVTSV